MTKFGRWLNEVDKIVYAKVGVSVYDLADFPSRDCFDAGMSPEEGADEAISSDDVFSQFEGLDELDDDPEFGEDEFVVDY